MPPSLLRPGQTILFVLLCAVGVFADEKIDLHRLAPVPADQPIPVQDFFRPPLFARPKLNATGTWFAASIDLGDHTGLMTCDLSNMKFDFLKGSANKDLYSFTWLDRTKLVTSWTSDRLYAVGLFVTDATKLKIGQAATMSFDALGGTTVTGKVTVISPTSTTVSNVISYPVQIALDTPNPLIKPGMTANVSVVVDERDAVLSLPSTALSGRGTAATVLVKTSSGSQSKRVQVGLRGDNAVEITSGVSEGDQVVILPTTSSVTFGTGRLGGGATGGAVIGGGGGAGRVGG